MKVKYKNFRTKTKLYTRLYQVRGKKILRYSRDRNKGNELKLKDIFLESKISGCIFQTCHFAQPKWHTSSYEEFKSCSQERSLLAWSVLAKKIPEEPTPIEI